MYFVSVILGLRLELVSGLLLGLACLYRTIAMGKMPIQQERGRTSMVACSVYTVNHDVCV